MNVLAESRGINMNRGFLSNAELRTPMGRLFYTLAVIFLLVVSLMVLFPFIFAFTSGLKGNIEIYNSGMNLLPENPQWENYTSAWSRFEMARLFGNTIWIVGVAVVLRLAVSAAAAYSLSHLKPIGSKWITSGLLLTLMVPGMAYFVPLYVTISDIPILHVNLLNNYWGLWLPYCVDAFGIFVLKTFFDNIPTEIIDSARVDGASAWQNFLYIVLPLSRSIMIVLAVVSFVGIWKDYLLPMLVITNPAMQPITVRLFTLMDNNYGVNLQMAASFIALLPPLVIALVLQRYMTMGLTIGAVKG
jgi:multiple sugar transport system permease protein